MTDTKTDALVSQGSQALTAFDDFITMERPEGKDEGELGNEGIGREDIILPANNDFPLRFFY